MFAANKYVMPALIGVIAVFWIVSCGGEPERDRADRRDWSERTEASNRETPERERGLIQKITAADPTKTAEPTRRIKQTGDVPPTRPAIVQREGSPVPYNEAVQLSLPEASEKFHTVSVGQRHGCGVRMDGTVGCWGWNAEGQATPPEGEFVSVDAGAAYTCGLTPDSAVICWGA